ncbi:MAG: HNH endonuclease [Bifidobacteriaceae bacterium]|jgi:hypothetical protein|nr:HNH endonuclease [Bifidobacteriaceae bacterium]
MTVNQQQLRISEAAALIRDVLDTINLDTYHLDTDQTRIQDAHALLELKNRLDTLTGHLLHQINTDGTIETVTGVDIVSHLAAELRYTRQEANSILNTGQTLAATPLIEQAALAGGMTVRQAVAAAKVLGPAAKHLDPVLFDQAETTVVEQARRFDSKHLTRLTKHLVDVVDPEGAEQAEASRVEREYQRSVQDRRLSFQDLWDGKTIIRGVFPTIDIEPLKKLVTAHAQQLRRSHLDEERAGGEACPGWTQLQADGLLLVAEQAQAAGGAPLVGGDRPRINVTINLKDLQDKAERAGLVGTGETVPAGVLRRLVCDADLVPVVLGTGSEPLDVGRSHRLVTPSIRAALNERDGGCVFPGCDLEPVVCHAHHVEPWWDGGETKLDNLVLVCPRHHMIVEPDPSKPPGDRWEVRVEADGFPVVTPPLRVDPDRKPRLHQRFMLRQTLHRAHHGDNGNQPAARPGVRGEDCPDGR